MTTGLYRNHNSAYNCHNRDLYHHSPYTCHNRAWHYHHSTSDRHFSAVSTCFNRNKLIAQIVSQISHSVTVDVTCSNGTLNTTVT